MRHTVTKETDIINAQSALDQFIRHGASSYAKARNYDLGQGKHSAVSNLSKFVSHRLLFEFDIIEQILGAHSYQQTEKFIQEVFWRVYWKGWLENRPQVWSAFKNQPCVEMTTELKHAQIGNTGIGCFDSWVEELRDTNYLHNHARMWFASIWIFTLKLPWHLGARFFMAHLYDGDAASNTLSWRWVAGLQTKGKHYVAKSSNIAKYTDHRFPHTQLNENPIPLTEDIEFSLEGNLPLTPNPRKFNQLAVFETDLHLHAGDKSYADYEVVYVISLDKCHRHVELSESVANFKTSLLRNFSETLSNARYITSEEFSTLASSFDGLDVVYPFVGDCLDFINELSATKQIPANYLLRAQDLMCWRHAKKGFFSFKKQIKSLILQTTSAKPL